MQRIGDETHVTSTEASGGVKNHGVRYVLMFSLLIAIAALSAVWMTGAWLNSNGDTEKPHRMQGVAVETG
jgi:hypothetical protein